MHTGGDGKDLPCVQVRRPESVLSREILDEAVLLHPAGGLYFGVNPSGCLLWSAMAGAITLRELTRLLVTRFGILDAQAWGM